MITLETLRDFGADVDEGLARCLNKEDFYLKMVDLGLSDERFTTIKDALDAKNLDTAFEMAHALKGVLGNLALTPILAPVSEMTELLRARTDMDYAPLYQAMRTQYDKLLALKE